MPPRNLATGLTSPPPFHNQGYRQNRTGKYIVLRCKFSQFFPIKEDQTANDEVDCIVDNIQSWRKANTERIHNVITIKEVSPAQPVKHQCSNCYSPRSLLIFNQETEEREQHIEHKNHSQCPADTNHRDICIRQKSLAQSQIGEYFIQCISTRRNHKV